MFCFLFSDHNYECPVCLQKCVYPVQLPCRHIFCFLCVKGVANRSKKCALCRQEVPVDFLNNPTLISENDLEISVSFDEGYQWFYEGRNGWWQYDDRTSVELESKYKTGNKVFELLIAGFLYIVDLENMVQYRRNDRTKKRRVRRDLSSIPGVKGVAGLKMAAGSSSDRSVGDGESNRNAQQVPQLIYSTSDRTTTDDAYYLSPPAPNNTPQTPQTPAGSPPNSMLASQQDLTAHFQQLSLVDSISQETSHARGDNLEQRLSHYQQSDEDD